MNMDVVYEEWAKSQIIETDDKEILDLSPIKLGPSLDEKLQVLETKMMDRLDDIKTTLTARFDANDARQLQIIANQEQMTTGLKPVERLAIRENTKQSIDQFLRSKYKTVDGLNGATFPVYAELVADDFLRQCGVTLDIKAFSKALRMMNRDQKPMRKAHFVKAWNPLKNAWIEIKNSQRFLYLHVTRIAWD